MMVVVDRWTLFGGGGLFRFDCNFYLKFIFLKMYCNL
jgi:hypothetical protein